MKKHWLMAAAALAAAPASAQLDDPAGDFLATYSGPQNADLDILSASVTFDGTKFYLSSTHAGDIGTSAGSLFVWGINRGSGVPRLSFGSPSIGADKPFDAVAVMFPDGTGRVAAFPLAGPPLITPLVDPVSVTGSSISAIVPLSLLGSMGLAPQDYTFALWSRRRVDPLVDGTTAEVADFAPDIGVMTARSVPEPATWATLLFGFGGLAAALRTRRHPGVRTA